MAGEGPVHAEARSDSLQLTEQDPLAITRAFGRFVMEVAPQTAPIMLLIRDAAVSDQQTVARKPAERVQKLPGWPRDPYKGLDYFSAADAPLFGQRETEINDMVALLCSFDTRAVLLHGGTGTTNLTVTNSTFYNNFATFGGAAELRAGINGILRRRCGA